MNWNSQDDKTVLVLSIGCHCVHVYTSVFIPFNTTLNLSIVAWYLAGVCYLASIIPLTATQLIGPSGEELSLAVHWLLLGCSMGQLLSKGLPC